MRDWRSAIVERFANHSAVDPATAAEIIDELTQHFELRESELRHSGESPASIDARLEQDLSELDLESLVGVRRKRASAMLAVPMETRPTFADWLDSVVRDVVVGYRSLRRTLGVTSVIAFSLAIVLGANTAVFGLVDAMYLRRLDLPMSEHLARVDVLRDGRPSSLPYDRYRSVRSAPAVPPLAGFRFEPVIATTAAGDEQKLWIDMVTGDFFDLVGVKPLIGRSITPLDEKSRAQVAVVSERYWRQHLGARAEALGQTLRLNSTMFTIVGVMPERYHGIHFAHQFQIAAPFTVSPTGFPDPGIFSTTIVARLDGRRASEAQRAAIETAVRICCANRDAIYSREDGRATNLKVVQVNDPPYGEGAVLPGGPPGLSVRLADASRGLTWGRDLRSRYRAAMVVMISAALLLLLVVCANVATLLLVRGEWRAREFAIRRSLGASIARVRRQLFVEALEVSLLGGTLGLFLAWLVTTLLARALPPSAQSLGDVIAWRPNAHIVGVTFGITAVCALVSCLWPARRAGREELAPSLAGTRSRGAGSWTGQRVLAIGQIAAAMVLITSAWLLLATTRNLLRGAGGYGSRDVVLGQVDARALMDSGMSAAAIDALRDDLLRAPGMTGAAYSYNAPLMQDALMQARIALPGSTVSGPITARVNLVSPDFFRVSGAGMASGREFTRHDDAHSDVAIVSESFERRYYPGRTALGMTIELASANGPLTLRIVGVARDARYDRMAGSSIDLRNLQTDIVYQPFVRLGSRYPAATMILRSDLGAATAMQQLRRALAQRNGMQLYRVTSVGAWLDDGASRERFSAALATAFGALAVLLSAIGVLGVLAFQVARRTKEIGVRMALGAQRRDTVALVVRQTLGMLATAVAFGVPCAAAAAWLVRSQLYGVAPWDVRALLAAAGVILVAGLAASVVPSYRAACVDPLVALRED